MRVYPNGYKLSPAGLTAGLIVSMEEAKDHLRVKGNEEYQVVENLIRAAGAYIDEVAGKIFTQRTYKISLASAPYREMLLPVAPVLEVISANYFDAAGISQVYDHAQIDLYSTSDDARIWLKPDAETPAVYPRPDAFEITFVAGFEVVPQEIKQAALMIVSHWHLNRSETTNGNLKEIPVGAETLIGLHRKGWVA